MFIVHVVLSRANYMHSDAASQGGGWRQGCGAAYPDLAGTAMIVSPARYATFFCSGGLNQLTMTRDYWKRRRRDAIRRRRRCK